MSLKNSSYQTLTFSSETAKGEFYIFSSVPELVAKTNLCKDDIFLCRTVGILHSIDGRYFLTDVDKPIFKEEDPKIRVTMVYLKTPVRSTVLPYSVQIFGTLQWKNRPVIFAKIVQVLNSSMALRVRDTMNAVVTSHLAREQDYIFDETIPDMNDTFILDSD